MREILVVNNLSKYFGEESNLDDGYIGKWKDGINKVATIYYILMERHEIRWLDYLELTE